MEKDVVKTTSMLKAELRKTDDPVMPDNFEPGHSLKDMLRRGLQELNPQTVALQLEKGGGGGGGIVYFKP